MFSMNCYITETNLLTDFINRFPANIPILYPLKISENQRFSCVLGGIARNGLIVDFPEI